MKYLNSAYVSISGITAALSVVIMIGSVFPSMGYAVPMVAGGILIIPVAEFGSRKTLPIYFSVFVLSMVIPIVAKDAALMYLMLFGLYPILQFYFERIRRRFPRILAKLIYFNISAVLSVYLAWKLFALPFFEESVMKWVVAGVLLFANIVFLIYDLALYKLAYLYDVKYSARFRKIFKIHK